jgi:hypothetical protein
MGNKISMNENEHAEATRLKVLPEQNASTSFTNTQKVLQMGRRQFSLVYNE